MEISEQIVEGNLGKFPEEYLKELMELPLMKLLKLEEILEGKLVVISKRKNE